MNFEDLIHLVIVNVMDTQGTNSITGLSLPTE